MKRDMSLARELLFWLELKPDHKVRKWNEIEIDEFSSDEIGYNLIKMYEGDLISGEAIRSSSTPERIIEIWPFSLSWQGHEFLEAVRDEDIWEQTKSGTQQAGGFSLEIVRALAKEFIKKKVKEHTGIEIDI